MPMLKAFRASSDVVVASTGTSNFWIEASDSPSWLRRLEAVLLSAFKTSVLVAAAVVTMFALAILLGLSGQDFRRWSMDHRGFTLAQVIAARSEPDALGVLLARRPDLAGSFLPPGATR